MSTETGLQAEAAAAEYLKKRGYKIISQNWRNRYCEIDIVAQKNKVVHFVEVKYRKSANYGEGFEYITPDKVSRLKRAAEVWMAESGAIEAEYQIDVISISGQAGQYKIDYLPNAVEA